MKIFPYFALFILVFTLLIPLYNPASAGPEDILWSGARPYRAISPLIPESGIMFHEPVSKVFSGAAQGVVRGEDVRFANAKKGAMEDWLKDNVDLAGADNNQDVRFQAAGAAALVPYRDPSQKFSRNILITRDFGTTPVQTEPILAVNPNDPEHLVMGTIDYNFANVVSYVSRDGGQTWAGAFQSKYLQEDLGAAGDPIAAFDRKGNVYMGCISIGSDDFSLGGTPLQETVSSISITRSSDGGETWLQPISSARSTISLVYSKTQYEGQTTNVTSSGTLRFGFLDKPWITTGPNPENLDEDIIYVTYTHFVTRYDFFFALDGAILYFRYPVLETTIQLVKSEDYGMTWSEPLAVSPTVYSTYGGAGGGEGGPLGEEHDRVVQFSNVFTHDDGTLYIAYHDSTDDGPFEGLGEIHVARSDDGGESISINERVATFNEPFYRSRNAPFRSWASAAPRGAVSDVDGSVSLVFGGRPSDKPTDDGDVYFVRSTNQGESWSLPKRINDDTKSAFQFFPALDVGPDGNIHVFFGDFRDSLSEITYHMYYTRSDDGGKTWLPNSRITDYPTNPNKAFPRGAFIGDYNDIKAVADDVYMIWTDGRLGEISGMNQKIAFARTKAMPTPSIFISPPSGPGGRDVRISGFDFQPDQEIYISVSGVIISSTRTNDDGLFNTDIFIPIAGEGAHTILAIEASGNVASASFFMDFGFNNLEQLENRLTDISESIFDMLQTQPSSNSPVPPIIPSNDIASELGDLSNLPVQINQLQRDVSDISDKTNTFETLIYTLLAMILAIVVVVFLSISRENGIDMKKIRELMNKS